MNLKTLDEAFKSTMEGTMNNELLERAKSYSFNGQYYGFYDLMKEFYSNGGSIARFEKEILAPYYELSLKDRLDEWQDDWLHDVKALVHGYVGFQVPWQEEK